MQTITQLLEELYQTDPSLKSHDQELRMALQELIDARPTSMPDSAFEQELRSKLMVRARELRAAPGFSGMPRFLQRLSFGPTAVLAVVLLVVVVVGFGAIRNDNDIDQEDVTFSSGDVDVKKFSSKEEFIAYLEQAQIKNAGGYYSL